MGIAKDLLLELWHGRPIYKGTLEDLMRSRYGSLGDTTSRRLRELTNAGKIIKVQDSEGNTMYKLKY